MSNLIEVILQNLMRLMPFVVVMSYQLGVRWTWGTDPVALAPGFHWRFYLVHTTEIVEAAERVINLPTQSVTLKDKTAVCFSANIGLSVTDPVAHYCAVDDFDASTAQLAMTHLAKRVRQMNFDELVDKLPDLEKSLRGTLETQFKKWGAAVSSVGFTDLVQVRHQFRLFGDPLPPVPAGD